MDVSPVRSAGDAMYPSYMERTLRELQAMVHQHEEGLKKLRATPTRQPADATQSAKATLNVMRQAYDEVSKSEPFLPFPESVLPALLALRKIHRTIAESQVYLATQGASTKNAKRQLDAEQADLGDQKALRRALEERIETLRRDLDSRMEMTPEQVVKEKLGELRQQKRNYDRETARLVKALHKFIDEHLAPMLAAEELGGPVVGGLMDIEPEDLAAGFNAHGRLKKAKDSPREQDKRQRRIDDIWGGADSGQTEREKDEWDETKAAGVEMRELTEVLLNTLVEAGGDSSAAYVKLPRESAAARFLVRSKVALFHPRDATRLRLVDFGRELDD